MVVGAKVCELTDGLLWFACGLYVGILTSPLKLQYFLSNLFPQIKFQNGHHDPISI